ncbi:hypothetical protein ACQJBY_007140 [Aegilops geniculata]
MPLKASLSVYFRRRGRRGAAHGRGVMLVVVVNWRERPPIHARPSTAGLPSSSNILSQFAAAIHLDGPGHTYQHYTLPPVAGDAAIIGPLLSAARTYKPSKLTFLCTGCTDRGVQVVASVHPCARDSHTLLAVCRVSLSSHAFIRLCN